MKRSKVIFSLISLIFFIGLVFSAPGLPHIFSGSVSYCDGFLGNNCDYEIPKGTEITATIGGSNLGVVGKVGESNEYGPLQIIPQGITGVIKFYVGGIETKKDIEYVAGQVNEGDGEDFDLKLEKWTSEWARCGDGQINEGEQCDIDDFSGDFIATCESVMLGYYGVSGYYGNLGCTSTCTYDITNCSLAPYCGDGIINNGETCSSCSQDVGECPVEESSSSSGSGGGSGGGSSGGSYTKKENVSTNETETNTEELSLTLGETNEENPEENEESKQGFFRTTGSAISDFSKTKTGKGVLVVIGIVLVIGVFMFFSTKKKNNIEKTFKK